MATTVMTVTELRTNHPTFTYLKHHTEVQGTDLVCTFFYKTEPNLEFQTKLTFHNVSQDILQRRDKAIIDHMVFQIGMVEAFSYWKAICSPKFVIAAGYLTDDQLMFWQSLLHKGMSEFFFVNQINGWEKDFVQFAVTHPETAYPVDTTLHRDEVIVPVGGGKDSVVSLEVLQETHPNLVTLTVNTNPQVNGILDQAGKANTNIAITRQLDPQIREFNTQGYLNGHIPFSAVLSFVTTCAAYLYDYHYVAVSNEYSANEGNTVFLGQTINHQYSKTLEYEQAFRRYAQHHLSSTIEYFSFLRPLHELQIAQIFSRFPEYFPLFLSCNRGQKTGKWCGECPKCMFVYIMLSPFLPAQQVQDIFSKNLFADEKLQPLLDELAGVVECKSLECVGTRQETLYALALTLQQFGDQPLPVLLQYVRQKIIQDPHQVATEAQTLLKNFQTDHCLPTGFEEILKHAL
jgi:UDP-N-acetyl-alpha-D-muramoyl-L-alanyl-L-glutamate epimerase